MKKSILFISFFVLGLALRAQHIDSLSFPMTQISLTTENGYTRVSMQSCDITTDIGYPELPCLKLKYVLPYDQEISSITILDSTLQLISNNSLVYPRQPDYPMDDTATHAFILPDENIYNNNTPYPLQIVDVSEQYYEKGCHLASIKVFPVRYTPSLNRLELFSHIRFQLNYTHITETAIIPQTQSQRMNHINESFMLSQIRNISDFVFNSGGPITVLDEDACATQSISLLDMDINTNPEYLIITSNIDVNGNSLYDAASGKNMADVFQELADWKTQKGTPTKVVTMEDIAANYSGNDIQEKIHNFLADVYNNYGSLYILFGGDVNVVPARMIPGKHDGVHYNNHLFYPVDLYYVAIDNSWDGNRNGIYGETVDNADNYPDFYYGRAPVETVKEASTFVLKCKEYENLSEINPIERKYVNNIVGMQAYLNLPGQPHDARMQKMEKLFDYVNSTNNLRSGISQNNIVKWRSYDPYDFVGSVNYENYNFNLSKNNALACFGGVIPTSNDKQAHIVLHCDHSSYLALGTSALLNNMTVDRNDILTFSNNPFYQILFTVGCSPGEYDKDCIVERFLNNASAGAVAVCASSQTSIVGEEDMFASFIKDLYDYEENGVMSNSDFFNLGVIHSKAASSYNTNNNVYVRKNHLFGDPELPIWTREPVDLNVTTTPSVITNQDNQLTVSVSGMAYSEYSTNDVDVCVMKDGEVYLRQHYDGNAHSHNFVFEDVNPETAGELKVTVTGHNYIPYETILPVTITGKNVYISEKSVVDATGNGDSNLDAGETDNLSITLKNNGTVNLTNVTATLSCEFLDENLNQNINDYLTLVTSTVNYSTIALNATVTKNDFQLALSNAIPDRTSLRCTLTISDGSGGICERSFTLLVRAPEIEYVSVYHEERPNGRIVLGIELNNLGYGTAKGITVTLASSDVQITEGTALYGAMTHLEAITQYFEFIPNGSIDGQSFTLTVTDAYNKSWPFDFILYDILNTVENLSFTNTEHSIKLKWDPVEGSKGYYVYRSTTESGSYERLNGFPVPSSVYHDERLGAKQTYYYEVSYLDEYGNESEKTQITAWTSLPLADGWPVSIPDNLSRAWGTAPNVADIDGDGKKEIFLTTGTGDQPSSKGAVLAFNSFGEELFDIDHTPTTISGFANLYISMTCTPAIGDIDNDGIMEVVVATRCDINQGNHKLCVYKNLDANNDGAPDLAWERPLDSKNFNGVVLADLDNDGTLEIIAPNQGRSNGNTHVEVFNCFGSLLYDILIQPTYNVDQKGVTMPIVADLDNDGHKEIVFGLEGGVYSWSTHNTSQLFTLVSYNQSNVERTDCPVIAADINGDGNLEILYMAIKNGNGYVRAINSDGTSVINWSGDTHFVPLSNTSMDWAWPPYFCVADINNDGSIEVFVADGGVLKMWDNEGNMFGIGEIQISDLDCRYFQPVIADVDGNGDCEIIVPSQNGYIYAYKPNGDAVPGWPLAVVDLATIPAITDIDGDGYNEVIAASQTELYVWHTEGESKYNQWDRFRYNKHNNAVYEIPCSYNAVPLEIMGAQVWNDDRHVNRDVIVNNGAHLTVKSELQFSEDSRIIVKPGGRLVLDGCRLTNACPNELWPGIEVWGNRSTHQYEINGSFGQGYVEMKNGATIENAVCALALWRPNHWSYTGGIVHATDAVFRNNQRSVHALYYKNQSYINGKETDYNAWFNRCQFIVDENYLGDEDHVFHKHVDLDHVRGFKFRACDFSVAAPSSNISYWTSGIAGNEAGFTVAGLCSNNNIYPCPSMDKSTFSGFLTAINAVNDGSKTPPTISVTHTSFSNNDFGIYACNLSNATILFCDFDVKRQDNWLCGAGIFIDYMYGFVIEENEFKKTNSFNGNSYGIIIKNSTCQSQIYRNTFTGLYCGNLAEGRNFMLKSSDDYLGLEYKCNTNIKNDIDFYVLKEDGIISGIQSSQGNELDAARNTFSVDGYHFYNGGDYGIKYYYYDMVGFEEEKPLSYNYDTLNPIPVTGTKGCDTHYGNNPVDAANLVLTPEAKQQLEQEYYEAHNTYHNLKTMYEQHVDGGSTQNTLNDISTATPSDMWALRAQLLGFSPYLSQEVLETASDREDVFTESVLFEILLSNPDELKKNSLMDHLRNKVNPLPQYMMDILTQTANGISAKTLMQNCMAASRRDFSRAAGEIVRSIINDSIINIDELRFWLANSEDINADHDIIATYVDEGDFTTALALADMLPDLYGLTGTDLVEHQAYRDLLILYRDWYNDSRNAMQMNNTERATVEHIADYGTGYPQIMAKALLAGLDWESYAENPFDCPTLTLPQGGQRGGHVFTQEDLGKALGLSISVKPNPATTWTAVDYSLPANLSKATITVSNVLGVIVMSTELNGNQGQKVLDLHGLADGVYLYTIKCGEYVQTGKLVIAK